MINCKQSNQIKTAQAHRGEFFGSESLKKSKDAAEP